MCDSSIGEQFDEVLASLPTPEVLPSTLPPVHITSARSFKNIVRQGELTPQMCRVFGEALLYLFYGGAFYRPRHYVTRNAAELPVAFVLDPSLLQSEIRYYPFDTGAIASGRFGESGESLEPFRTRFLVTSKRDRSAPCKLVYHLFESNNNYIKGVVNPSCPQKPEPIPQLFDFFSTDLTSQGVDHRQCVIECQTHEAIPLQKYLLWVGFPEIYMGEFADLCGRFRVPQPKFYQYRSHVNFSPAEIAAQLQDRAAEIIRPFEN